VRRIWSKADAEELRGGGVGGGAERRRLLGFRVQSSGFRIEGLGRRRHLVLHGVVVVEVLPEEVLEQIADLARDPHPPRVVAVPYLEDVFGCLDAHHDADHVRVFEELADGGEEKLLPALGERWAALVLLALPPVPTTLSRAATHTSSGKGNGGDKEMVQKKNERGRWV